MQLRAPAVAAVPAGQIANGYRQRRMAYFKFEVRALLARTWLHTLVKPDEPYISDRLSLGFAGNTAFGMARTHKQQIGKAGTKKLYRYKSTPLPVMRVRRGVLLVRIPPVNDLTIPDKRGLTRLIQTLQSASYGDVPTIPVLWVPDVTKRVSIRAVEAQLLTAAHTYLRSRKNRERRLEEFLRTEKQLKQCAKKLGLRKPQLPTREHDRIRAAQVLRVLNQPDDDWLPF